METDEWYTILECGSMPYYRFELRKDDAYLRVMSYSKRSSLQPQQKPRLYKLVLHQLPENIDPQKHRFSFGWFPLPKHPSDIFAVFELCRKTKLQGKKGTFQQYYRVEGKFKSLNIYAMRDYVLTTEETHG